MIFPIGSDISVRRIPYVTVTLIGLCVLAFLFLVLPSTRLEHEAAELYNKAMQIASKYYHTQKVYADKVIEDGDKFLEAFENGEVIDKDEYDYQQYMSYKEQAEELIQQHANFKFGFIPDKFSILGLIGHMFMHGGFWHLLGNMWFLWLVGVNLEDRWGRYYYLSFYMVSGIVAAIGFGLYTQTKGIPLVGASGAIAGLMGAFMVRFYNAKIKFFYFFLLFFRPIWGTFKLTAWFAAGLWFLWQVAQNALYAGVSNVAFMAHIIGFIFGAGVAILLKVTGIEKKFLDKVVAKEKAKDSANPLVGEADDAIEAGEFRKAEEKLLTALEVNPNNLTARIKLIRIELDYMNNLQGAIVQFNKLLDYYRNKGDAINFLVQFNNFAANFTGRTGYLSELNEYYLGYSYAVDQQYKKCIEIFKQFTKSHPNSNLVPKVLFNSAKLYTYKLNNPQLGQKLMYVILKRYPMLPWKSNIEKEIENIKSNKFQQSENSNRQLKRRPGNQ